MTATEQRLQLLEARLNATIDMVGEAFSQICEHLDDGAKGSLVDDLTSTAKANRAKDADGAIAWAADKLSRAIA